MKARRTLLIGGLSVLFLLHDASAEPPPDPVSIWTLQDENATLSTSSLTDRYYVNGALIGWTSPTGYAPEPLADLATYLFGDGQNRIGFSVMQDIFTPANTTASRAPPGDEPYAGYLTATGSLLQDTDRTRNLLAVSLGVIGPIAQAEEVQNGFHGIIGQGTNKGWGSQLHTEFAAQFLADRVWREPIGQIGGLETDVLPEVQIGIGTVEDYALAGVNFRIGSGLRSDFGAPRLPPGTTGSTAYQPVQPFAWYVFAGVNGQAKAHDEFLQGNDFSSSDHVRMNYLVGEGQVGVAVMYAGVRLSYTQVFQTETFKGQKGGLHQFGSIALSARF